MPNLPAWKLSLQSHPHISPNQEHSFYHVDPSRRVETPFPALSRTNVKIVLLAFDFQPPNGCQAHLSEAAVGSQVGKPPVARLFSKAPRKVGISEKCPGPKLQLQEAATLCVWAKLVQLFD